MAYFLRNPTATGAGSDSKSTRTQLSGLWRKHQSTDSNKDWNDQKMLDIAQLTSSGALEDLGTRLSGLSSEEVKARQLIHGPNSNDPDTRSQLLHLVSAALLNPVSRMQSAGMKLTCSSH